MSEIHATAIVHKGAQLGENVSIGPQCYVEEDVRIGDGCVLGPRVSVLRYTTLGPNCRVHTGAVLGDTPQDLAFDAGTCSFLDIGADCVIREYVTLHRGTKAETRTQIGDGCFLMGLSHCAHNVRLGNGVIMANGVLLAGYVAVGDRAFLSGNVLVHQFCRIGRLAMLSGGSAVSKDVPPFCTVRGVSANRVAALNVVGMRRAGIDAESRMALKKAFKILYLSDLNTSQAVEQIRRAFDAGPAREMAEFVAVAKRGICAYGEGVC